MTRHLLALQDRTVYEEVERWARVQRAAGRPAALWVQDLHDGGPFAAGRPRDSVQEEVGVQLPLLRRLATEHGVAVAVGHLDDLDGIDDWQALHSAADATFALIPASADRGGQGDWRLMRDGGGGQRLRGGEQVVNWRGDWAVARFDRPRKGA